MNKFELYNIGFFINIKYKWSKTNNIMYYILLFNSPNNCNTIYYIYIYIYNLLKNLLRI
jgi:hypothetical protein